MTAIIHFRFAFRRKRSPSGRSGSRSMAAARAFNSDAPTDSSAWATKLPMATETRWLLYLSLTASRRATPSGRLNRTTGSPLFGDRSANLGSGAMPTDRRAKASAASVSCRFPMFSGTAPSRRSTTASTGHRPPAPMISPAHSRRPSISELGNTSHRRSGNSACASIVPLPLGLRPRNRLYLSRESVASSTRVLEAFKGWVMRDMSGTVPMCSSRPTLNSDDTA